MRFRDRHQDPDATDIEYAARINGFVDVDEFIAAHSGSPWFTSMVGFVAGLPFKFQMVPAGAADRRAEVPAPAHRHPEADGRLRRLLLAASTRCAAPAATRCSASPRRRSTTRRQTLPDFTDFMVFFRPGDIVKFTADRPRRVRRPAWPRSRRARSGSPRRTSSSRCSRSSTTPTATTPACWRCSHDTTIEVRKPGLSTTVQDSGRTGYYHLGIPPSGALDQYSLRRREPARRQPRRRRGAGVRLHGTGAAVHRRRPWSPWPAREHRAAGRTARTAPLWESFAVAEGDVLDFGYLTAGARAYLAVSGGHRRARVAWAAAPPTGSARSAASTGARSPRATCCRSAPVAGAGRAARCRTTCARPCRKDVEVRVVMGLYDHRLTDRGRATFLDTTWTLTPVADRIGFRYSGRPSWRPSTGSRRSGPVRTRRTSWTRRTRSARSRCRAAWSRSCCTATRSPAAAT